MGKIIIHPPGTPLPANSPLRGTTIIMGIKRPPRKAQEAPTEPIQGHGIEVSSGQDSEAAKPAE